MLRFEKIKQITAVNIPYESHRLIRDHFQQEFKPGLINYLRLRKTKHLGYMVHNRTQSMFYMTDRKENVIKMVDKCLNTPNVKGIDENGLEVKTKHCGINPKNILNHPVGICINSREDVFVACHGSENSVNKGIFVFNSIFSEHIGSIGVNHEDLKTPSCIEIEDYNNNCFHLYASDWFSSNITKWKIEYDGNKNIKYTGELLKKQHVISPSTIRIKNNYLFVVSEVSWITKYDRIDDKFNIMKNEVDHMSTGLNAVLILNKETLEEIRMIDLTHLPNLNASDMVNYSSWIGPQGLFVDENLNIFTAAYKLNELAPEKCNDEIEEFKKKFEELSKINAVPKENNPLNDEAKRYHSKYLDDKSYSKNMYLVITNFDGKKIKHVELPIEYIGDFLVFYNEDECGDKILFLSQRKDSALHLVEFS